MKFIFFSILFFSILNTSSYCQNLQQQQQIKNTQYQEALQNLDISIQIIKNEIPEIPLKDFMIAVIQFHYLRFDEKSNLNASILTELQQNLISLMYKFNYFPHCWKKIDYHLDKAKECFLKND